MVPSIVGLMAKRKKTNRQLDQSLFTSTEIVSLSKDSGWAQHLYATLCNNTFVHKNTAKEWSCTWRFAAGIVAELRNKANIPKPTYPPNRATEDYLYWYCIGDEGTQFPEIVSELEKLGWETVRKESNGSAVHQTNQ